MRPSGARRIAGRLLASLGLLYIVVSATPLVTWWARLLRGPGDDPTGDLLIVLGGSQLDDGLIGDSSYWRSVYAVRVYRSGGAHRILITGGPPQQPVSMAMREFIQNAGVPAEALRIETNSESTRENALAVARLVRDDDGRKVLLTSDYHMFRASRVFAKAQVAVLSRPIPDALKRATRWYGRWPVFLDLCTESLKILYYRARGWI